MTSERSIDPLDGLSRRQRRWWRAAERRARLEHEAAQMALLRDLAAARTAVTAVRLHEPLVPEMGTNGASPIELVIDPCRLRGGRVHRRTAERLGGALTSVAAQAPVALVAVDRYGPYWVLTFEMVTEPLVLLVEHLTLVPDRRRPAAGELVPAGPAVTAPV